MAVDPSVRIDIAAEFTGKKAFDKADKSTAKLTKNVKSLAKGFLGVFAAQKLLSYGKASVKAFAADDAAAKSLGITLKNLGLAYGSNAGTVNGFINRLEAQTGVLDDELRPAMDRFLRATNDVAKSQELLNLSLDVAAGTGKSVTQVSQSLQKAYLGQTAAIGRLGVGISKAELANASFEDIQKKLNTLFAGQATAAANTYQGSLDKLTVASNNAKETIGKGLVDALGILSGSATIDPTVSAIDRIAKSIANATKGFADFIAVTKAFANTGLTIGADEKAAIANRKMRFTIPMTISSQDTQRADKLAADRAKAAAVAKAKADKLAASTKVKTDKSAAIKDLALKKAASAFDLTRIQIAAALKATYDKDERLRLLAMQAIEDENGDAALSYLKMADALTKEQQTNKLAGIKTISETELNYINQLLLDELQRIKTTKMSEEEAALARQAAYAKYNAAIQQSGGLAEANFYTEKTQVELLSIAKLASLDKVAAAQATMDILNYTTQIDIIARVATAQKIADDAKYKAQQDYLALLATQVVIPAPIITPPSGGGGSQGPRFGIGGQPIWDDGMGGPGYGTGQGTGSSGSSSSSITVIVEGNVLDGDDFTDKVNTALLNAQRTGLSKYPAGFLID
jgi:hypothetical protein